MTSPRPNPAAAEPPLAPKSLQDLRTSLRRMGMELTTTAAVDEAVPLVQPLGVLPAVFYGTGCVRLKPSVRPDVLQAVGLRILKQLHFAPNLFIVKARGLVALQRACERLAGQYVYCEVEGSFTAPVASAARATADPHDPRLGEQPYLDSMGIRRAWARSTGKGVTIGIVDAEFDVRSRELAPNWDWSRAAYLATDPREGPVFRTVSDESEYPGYGYAHHGTRCAALAAAAAYNDVNGVGVAYGSRLMAIATGHVVSPVMAARALAYCADPGTEGDGRQLPGCRVIACSMTDAFLQGNHPVVRDALDFLVKRDVLLVSAVSNHEPTLAQDFVSTHPCAISVASVNADGERMRHGARGPGLDCVAQTLGIHGTTAPADGWTALGPGNSWAAPVVAGVVALLRAAHPSENAARIKSRLLRTCRDMHAAAEFGHGLVQADAALDA